MFDITLLFRNEEEAADFSKRYGATYKALGGSVYRVEGLDAGVVEAALNELHQIKAEGSKDRQFPWRPDLWRVVTIYDRDREAVVFTRKVSRYDS